MLLIFSTPVLFRHLRQLKTVVFLHWCLIRAVLLKTKAHLHYAENRGSLVSFSNETVFTNLLKHDSLPRFFWQSVNEAYQSFITSVPDTKTDVGPFFRMISIPPTEQHIFTLFNYERIGGSSEK